MGWFGDRAEAAVEDFWRIYRAHLDANLASARALDARGGGGGESIDHRVYGAIERMELAIAGKWEPFETHLESLGSIYAQTGMEFAAWNDVTQAFYETLVPELVLAFHAEPARLSAALLVLGDYMRRSLSIIALSYTETRNRMRASDEERHRRVVEASLDPVIAMDAAGTVTSFNHAAAKAFGVAREHAIGRSLAMMIIPPAFRDHFSANVARYLASSSDVMTHRSDVIAMRADGSEFPAELALAAYPAPDGRREITAYVRDLTDRRVAEDTVALWQRFLEQAHVGVAVSDPATRRMVQVNPAYARLVGYSLAELAQFPIDALLDPGVPQALEHATRELIERGFSTYEVVLRKKDGSSIPVLASSSTVTMGSGSQLRISTVVDYTAYRALAVENAALVQSLEARVAERTEQLARANSRKSDFLAGLSHELRTPLNAIIGFSELMVDDLIPRDAPETTEFLGDILTSGKHLLQLVNALLDLAKIEAGKLEFVAVPCRLSALIEEVLTVLRSSISKRGLAAMVEIAAEIDDVVLDPPRLKQVLYNYLSNAIKFTPDGGRLVVRTAVEAPGVVRIEVEDTGPGLTHDELAHMFVDFEQTLAGKQTDGTGLGLALTKRLVEAQGGTVGVRSVLGRGSVFWATLPSSPTR